jgi:hypothetical protein
VAQGEGDITGDMPACLAINTSWVPSRENTNRYPKRATNRLVLLAPWGLRQRLEYPALKRAVREQQNLYRATEILIEDKASGTPLIQKLIAEGCYSVTRYVRR